MSIRCAMPSEEHCRIRALTLLSKRPPGALDYFDLYRPCIANNPYLGEVTPEYMILPEAGVSAMSNSLGRSTKIILLATNPVQRFLSAVKLLAAHNAKVGSAQRFGEEVKSKTGSDFLKTKGNLSVAEYQNS